MRALFLSTNTARAAVVRYRALQYFPYLERAGIACTHHSLFDEPLDRMIYRSGHTAEKIARLASCGLRRVLDVALAREYDVVVLLREAFLVGPPFLEALLRARRQPLVLDMDDAVWEPYDSPTYGRAARYIKCAWKTAPTVRMAAAITCGNAYVADYARIRHARVTILPTVVDTDIYRPVAHDTGEPVLGWIGSHSTVQYLRTLFPVLERLASRVRFRLRLVGADDAAPRMACPVESVPWRLENEVPDVQSFDIGLYPVVEDTWSRGKSGFKAVQYGAVGIPTVASPVTTNRDIVVDGETGFLPSSPSAWAEALERLIVDASLRQRLGRAARARIEADYSLHVHAPRLASLLHKVAGSTP